MSLGVEMGVAVLENSTNLTNKEFLIKELHVDPPAQTKNNHHLWLEMQQVAMMLSLQDFWLQCSNQPV